MKKLLLIVTLVISIVASSGVADRYSAAPAAAVWYDYGSSSHHWMYAQLSYDEKCAYASRYDAYALGKAELWDISRLGLSSWQQERVEFAVNNDCPELMLCAPLIRIANFEVLLGGDEWLEENAREIRSDLAHCERALRSVNWGSSDLAKVKAFDSQIANKTHYLLDDDGPEGSLHLDSEVRSAKSAIVNRRAVCEGYSRSAQLAIRYSGVPCIYVTGKTKEGNGHAWVMVRIDNRWYHYDPTWNEGNNYFTMSDKERYRDVTVDSRFAYYGFDLPSCGK